MVPGMDAVVWWQQQQQQHVEHGVPVMDWIERLLYRIANRLTVGKRETWEQYRERADREFDAFLAEEQRKYRERLNND